MHNLYTLNSLVGRNIKLFLRDRAAVFFSLLAPIIVIMLYVLFLGGVQVDGMKQLFRGLIENGVISASLMPTDKAIKSVVDSWMLGGVLAITCLTVSLSANTVMVGDKSSGVRSDSLASPVKQWVVSCSYYIFNFIATIVICSIVFVICLIYKAIGGFHMTFLEVLASYGILILSSLSATLLTVLIADFTKSEAALNSIVGIFSAAVGFLIGAYMPISSLPSALQGVVGLFPGTHSAGLFKNFLLQGSLDNLLPNMPIETMNVLKDSFGTELDLFGTKIGASGMIIYLLSSVAVLLAINIIIQTLKSRNKKPSLKIK